MPEFLFSTSQLYLTQSQHLESYFERVLIDPNKEWLTKFIAVFTTTVLLVISVKLYLNGNSNFWEERGVTLMSTSEVSSILAQLCGQKNKDVQDLDPFEVFYGSRLKNKKFFGLMEAGQPVLLVKDVDLAKRILFEDFDHFVVNRRKFMLEKTDPLIMYMLSNLTGREWREMRTAAVAKPAPPPLLSDSKAVAENKHLHASLFSHFNSSGAQLVELVRRKSEKVGNHTDGISVTECFGRFTMDVIATACFGVESSCVAAEKESAFYKYGKMFQSLGPRRMAKVFIAFFSLRVATLFRISFIEQESRNFLKNIVEQTINHRKNNEKEYGTPMMVAAAAPETEKKTRLRQHFLQILVDTRDKEMKIDEAKLHYSLMTGATAETPSPLPRYTPKWAGCNEKIGTSCTNATTSPATSFFSQDFFTNSNDSRSNAENKLYLTDELILAPSMLSSLAEFNTALAHLLSFLTYVLAVHPDCQEKLYSEIEQCLRKKRELDCDSINGMQYMDMLLNETLRMFSTATHVGIKCAKEYQVDDTNLNLPRGTPVVIPVIAFHYNERYFPDPDKFNVERFSPKNRSKFHPSSFIPFGYGPRNSICRYTARYTRGKTALAHLASNFIIEPSPSALVSEEYDNFSPLQNPVRMMKIRFRPRK